MKYKIVVSLIVNDLKIDQILCLFYDHFVAKKVKTMVHYSHIQLVQNVEIHNHV